MQKDQKSPTTATEELGAKSGDWEQKQALRITKG